MKSAKRALQLLALGYCVFFHSAPVAAEGEMSAEERAKVVKLLKESQAETLEALEKLSDAQLTFKSAPGRWSVLECAEHIMLSEGLLFGMVQKVVAGKPNPDWDAKTKGKTEFIEKALVDRSGKAQAPEELAPSGKLTRAQVIEKFKEARAVTLKYAEQTQVPLKAHTLEHPAAVFGTLNGYQWLMFIPLHNVRHNLQIAEIKADANFPKK